MACRLNFQMEPLVQTSGNLKRNSCIFIQENAFENGACEMEAILSRPESIKSDVLTRR